MTLKELIENPGQRFWDAPYNVEPDAEMAQLIARSKANPKKPEQADIIARAKRRVEETLNKRINRLGTMAPFCLGGVYARREAQRDGTRYQLVCQKCNKRLSLPILPPAQLEHLPKICPPCVRCGEPDSWVVEEAKPDE
jgi:hypothetical protein